MRIAVIGAGGLGGFYGGLLARAGHDVTFIVRGATLDALADRGLRVVSADPARAFALGAVAATDDPAAVGPVDVVLHTTKASGFRAALEAALPLVGEQTLVVTVQNGVETPEVAAALIGPARVVPGIVRVFTRVVEPGVVEFMGGPSTISLGTYDGRPDPALDAFAAALSGAGVTVLRPDDIWADLWQKAMYVVPLGGLGGLTGDPIGVMQTGGALADAYLAAVGEIEAVGRARGVALPADAAAATVAFTDAMPADGTTSMQRDILAGLPSELDAQVGAVVRRGDAAGVPTPLLDLVLRALTARGRG